MTRTVIGLMGYSGAGKDTVAGILETGYHFHRLAFADELKRQLLELDPVVSVHVEADGWVTSTWPVRLSDLVSEVGWDEAKPLHFGEVRRLLQTYAQMMRENVSPRYWIDQLDLDLSYPNTVISDVRYRNEAEYILALEGQLWVIERPGRGPINGHESDRPVWEDLEALGVPVVHIQNDGTRDDLSLKVLRILEAEDNVTPK